MHDPFTPDALTFQPVAPLAPGQRTNPYWDVERLCRGPEPVPDWLVTDRAAVDTDLGLLKTGKEADCLLLERAVPGGASCVLAAKRYRSAEHRQFQRSTGYQEGRKIRGSREARAAAKKSSFGRAVLSGQWVQREWEALTELWSAGVPVPYPVMVLGNEICMELITSDGEPAPRLVGTRPSPALLADAYDQLREAMTMLASYGWAHGDLSPYNVLLAGDRIVLIDLPQVVDVVTNPHGMEFLMRDCHTVTTWFQRRGLDVDEGELFAHLVGFVC